MKKRKPTKVSMNLSNLKKRIGSNSKAIIFVIVFAVIGVVLLIAARAANPVANIEPERGTITSPATACTDAGASSGSCVKFMAATTPPPSPTCTRTISSGINSAISSMSNGQVLCLNSGTYSENVTLNKSITLQAAPGAATKPKINSINVTVGSTAVLGLEITSSANPLVRVGTATGTKIYDIVFKYNKIHSGPGNGMITFGNNLTFESNEMHTFGNEDAIRIWGDGAKIRNNYIHDVQNSGHNDPFQTWIIKNNSYGSTPITNMVLEDNIIRNFPGGHGHCFMMSSFGLPHRNIKVIRNRLENIGSHCFIMSGVRENGDADGTPDIGVQGMDFYYNRFTNIGGFTIKCELQSFGNMYKNTFSGASGIENRNGNCDELPSAPAGVSPTRPAYDVTWPI
jgi:hypothetical protein